MPRQNATARRQKRQQRKDKQQRVASKKELANAKAAAAGEEDEDLDALLAQFQALDKEATTFREVVCKAPSPRAYAVLAPHPLNHDELVLLGGEFNNGHKTLIYGDLFVYNAKKDQWRQLTIPGCPPPRSGHQAVTLGRLGGQMWLYGGEFAAPSGAQFRHYNDLWVWHMADNRWENMPGPHPPARSGHRMVVFKKNLLVMFGGFQDDGKKAPKYFNTVHIYDLDHYKWSRVDFPPTMPGPAARSACQMVALQDQVIITGGYARERVKGDAYKGVVFDDVWSLVAEQDETAFQHYEAECDSSKPKPPGKKDGTHACGYKWSWQRMRPGGETPPVRAGAAAVARSVTQMISFGGVQDEETDDALQGQFYNDAYLLNTANNMWARMKLKAKKGSAAAAAEEPLWPSARIGSLLAMQGNTLYLYGGVTEVGDRQVTFNDLYSIDVNKMQEWKVHVEMDSRAQEWLQESSSSEDEEDEEEEN